MNRIAKLLPGENIIEPSQPQVQSVNPIIAKPMQYATPKVGSKSNSIIIPDWNDEAFKAGGSILAGTGHRPDKLGGYQAYPQTLERLINIASEQLDRLQPARVVSGMAQGWDTALALAAIKKDIPVTAAVPFRGFNAKWTPDAHHWYNKIIIGADEVVNVVTDPVTNREQAIKALDDRNKWMIDNSSGLLALWNGERGGTFNAIRDAVGRKPIVNVWDSFSNPNPVQVATPQPIQQVVETNVEQPNRVAIPVPQPSRSYTLTHHPVTPDTYPKRRKKD